MFLNEDLTSECRNRHIRSLRLSNATIADVIQMVKDDIVGYTWGKALKLSIIRKNKIKFKSHLDFCEDTVFMTEYALACNSIIVEDERNYCYIKYTGNRTLSTQNCEIMLANAKKAFHEIKTILIDNGCLQTEAEKIHYMSLKPYYSAWLYEVQTYQAFSFGIEPSCSGWLSEEKVRSASGLKRYFEKLILTSKDEDWVGCCRSLNVQFFPSYLQRALLSGNSAKIIIFGTLYQLHIALSNVKKKLLS